MIRLYLSESYAMKSYTQFESLKYVCANPNGPWWTAEVVDRHLVIPVVPKGDVDPILYDFSELRMPDTYESLTYGNQFSYRDHTWNNVLNFQADGDLTTIDHESGYLASWLKNYKLRMDKVTFLLPGRTLQGIECEDSCKSGSGRLYHHVISSLIWDEKLYGWHKLSANFFTLRDEDGYMWISNVYGDKVRADNSRLNVGYSFWSIYFNPTAQRFAIATLNKIYSRYGSTLFGPYTPSGYDNTWVEISPYDTSYTVYEKFKEKVEATSHWVYQNRLTLIKYYYNQTWLLHRSLRRLPVLRKPNYSAIFSEKDYGDVINWHALAAEAYQSLGMADVNSVSNLKELLEMGGAVTGFIETLKSLPAKKVKAAASAWLAVHYGFKLTILDAIELRETLSKFAERRSNLTKCQAASGASSASGVYYTFRYQVFYDQFAKLESMLKQFLALSDAYITLENTWDMVPWSFVIDWFVQVGDWLQSLDNYANLIQKHDVICTGRSVKAEFDALPSQIGLYDAGSDMDAGLGTVTLKFFKRVYSPYLIKPSLLPSVTVNLFSHMIELAALYISIK